jgi:hypothetical protein
MNSYFEMEMMASVKRQSIKEDVERFRVSSYQPVRPKFPLTKWFQSLQNRLEFKKQSNDKCCQVQCC